MTSYRLSSPSPRGRSGGRRSSAGTSRQVFAEGRTVASEWLQLQLQQQHG